MSNFYKSSRKWLPSKIKITEHYATNIPDPDEILVYGVSMILKTSDIRLANKVAKIDMMFENDLTMTKAERLLDTIFDVLSKEDYREFYSNRYYFDNLEYYYVEDRDD